MVTKIVELTPNMRRITLGGEGLNRYPSNASGSYIKLFLEAPTEAAVRTSTIRNHRKDQCEIDVDFVLHGEHGAASRWAASECQTMRTLRQYFKKERGLPTSHAYISSYWKQGLAEDEHKIAKKQDAESGS